MFRRSFIPLLAATVLCATDSPVNADPSSDLFASATGVADAASATNPSILRSRPVQVDFDLLANLRVGAELRFNLFEDTSFRGVLKRSERQSNDGIAWVGQLVDVARGGFTLVVGDDVFVGNIRIAGERSFQIRYLADGVHVIREIDESGFPPCGIGPAQVVADEGKGGRERGGPTTAEDDGSILDVLVVYTAEARMGAGSVAAMDALVDLAIVDTNVAYENSLVNPRLRLVYKSEIDYVESGDFSTDLGRLRGLNDGYMDEVHPLRDDYAADLVALLVENTQYCGIGYLMTFLSPGFASNAFTVTARVCAAGGYTFGHEVGHNMGCSHDHDNADVGLYPYSFGHRYWGDSNQQWRTVMAYAPGARLQNFSNPDVEYDGEPTGIPPGEPNPAHNALSLNNAAYTVANFRPCLEASVTEPPHSRYACEGGSAFFSATITGTLPRSYQWRKNGVDIPNATDTELLIDPVSFGDAGDYDLVITNGCGIVTSNVATLTVVDGDLSTLFVDTAATPPVSDGSSWENAYTDLQQALFHATGCQAVTEIRVAKGLYTPAAPNGDKHASFHLIDGVVAYGGFPSAGGSWEERDWLANRTVLSGDLNGDDGEDAANDDDNSFHVVTGSGTSSSAVLDGFVVTGGRADTPPDTIGGGMYNDMGSPTVLNCTFTQNQAQQGGGVGNVFGAATFHDCTFVNNSATDGGGMVNYFADPYLSNCAFVGNAAVYGGGLCNLESCAPSLVNIGFYGNRASFAGGGYVDLFWDNKTSLINCTFGGNEAGNLGGAIATAISILTLSNCVLWNNTSDGETDEDAEIFIIGSDMTVSHSCVEGWTGDLGGTGNIGDDPQFRAGPSGTWTGDASYDPIAGRTSFVDANASFTENQWVFKSLNPDATQWLQSPIVANTDVTITVWGRYPTAVAGETYRILDYRPQGDSPCIDAGDNDAVPGAILADLDGRPRFVDHPLIEDTGSPLGAQAIVEMGSYEFQAGDTDGDGDVDLIDYAGLVDCFTNPSNALGPNCDDFDFDGDGDVDLHDWRGFQAAFTGSGP